MAIDANNIYRKQVQLLVRVLPLVDTEKCFALKGGTAINLFYRALPRLSVDIDLFGNSEINSEFFIEKLSEYGEVKVAQSTKNILITKINDIKVDFVNNKYTLL